MKVKVKRLVLGATIPQYSHEGDAGMDLCAVDEMSIAPREWNLVPTGIAIELPPGTEAQVRPRSGLALKHGITVLNSPGTIDQGYRGEIGVILINHSDVPFKVDAGARVAQLVIKPVHTVKIEEETVLSDTDRGSGGFGSTGTDSNQE